MKTFISLRSFGILTFLLLLFQTVIILSQDKNFVGTKIINENGKTAVQTIPELNTSEVQSMDDHLYGYNLSYGNRFALGGTILWWTDDQGTNSIANTVALNEAGNRALTAWTLNNMRVSLYSDANNTPIWSFSGVSNDPFIDISGDGSVIAATAGTDFYLLNNLTGAIDFQLTLPDSFYASAVNVARDGSMAVFLANAYGGSNTARAYAVDLSGGTPSVAWMMDVPVSEITNWAGVNFSASGTVVAITGRYHLYVLNSSDGTLIWDRFLDNTESPPAISGDGSVVATADNSGFIQTWVYNSNNNEYFLLWQYRVPPGAYTNWASSVGISADGYTILAGSLIFLGSSYDGSVMAFETFGDGTPMWIYSGVGDLVDYISVSDDGRVAAVATWGDLAHTKPDLLVFDVQTGEVTFDIITPGSFFTVDLTPDGSRVFAGGKAVHAREFGSGGRIYLAEIDLGGGQVSGTANLTDTADDSGVLIKVLGTTRTAITNSNGEYLLENLPAGNYTITAEKPGYNFGEVNNVTVTEGNTTTGIDFSMAPFPATPPTLSASSNLVGIITLNWTSLLGGLHSYKEIANMVGDEIYFSSQSQNGSKSASQLNFENDDDKAPAKFFTLLDDSIAIYRSYVSGGPYSRIASVSTSQSSYNDSNVVALKDYYYVVNIFNDIGQSVYSNETHGMVSDTLLTFSLDAPAGLVPTIDGVISAGEWDDAFKIDISDIFGYGGGTPIPQGSVFMYLKYDDNSNMLYVAGEDFLNPTLDDNEGFGLYFDDNNDDEFNSNPPFVLEGNFWAYWHPGGSNLRFREIPTYVVDTLDGAQVEFSDINGHLEGEVAIPMGFMEGYQLQVFGPDKIVGLGAFLIARQGGSAIFNGWWPQTMNTVFNPQYFGDVGIDVSLTAPPMAPSDINVEKQGNNLLLTWLDPSLGINFDPLPVQPQIHIYKNDEFLTTISSGIQTFLDNDVYCAGWYEYKFVASIQIDTTTFTGPMSAPVGNFACIDPVLTPIKYDDGSWDAFYVPSFSWEENKFAVRFTPTTSPITVRRLETLVNSNDAFDFTVQRDNGGVPGDVIAGPYRVFDTDPATVGTVIKTIPADDPPEVSGGDFWVVINYLEETPGSPGIGVDVTPPNDGRTMYYLSSSGWTNFTAGDLMITAYVSDDPVGVEGEANEQLPITFDLKQNYPNPFNPSTKIKYQLPSSQLVTLEIFDVLGRRVNTLVNEVQEAGYYDITWDGKNISGNSVTSGVYLCRINAGNFVNVIKMMLLR